MTGFISVLNLSTSAQLAFEMLENFMPNITASQTPNPVEYFHHHPPDTTHFFYYCFAKARSEPERNEDLNIVRSFVR